MKRTTLFTTMLTSLLLLSCNNDDDDLKLTKKEGQPGLFQSFQQNYETSIYFSYQENLITQIKYEGGSTTQYKYENGMPSIIRYSPPSGAADGNGQTRFIKEGDNKIRVESWGEPSFLLFVQEIELDNNQHSATITDIGTFEQSSEGLTKVMEGRQYIKITLDPITKNIQKIEAFSIENSELTATYAYEYDNNPGTMSAIDWPFWLRIYSCESRSMLYDLQSRQFFNYKNNLIKETVYNKAGNTNYTVNYTYTYNKNGYPVSATNDKYQEKNTITIRY